jgi:hypothetical protein
MRPLLLLPLLLLAGCDPHPRVAPTSPAAAMADRRPRHLVVLRVWDQNEQRLVKRADALVTHYIECEVVERTSEDPEYVCLPFDEVGTGRAPPEPGRIIVAAPADWLPRDPTTLLREYEQRAR